MACAAAMAMTTASKTLAVPFSMCLRANSKKAAPMKAMGMMMTKAVR